MLIFLKSKRWQREMIVGSMASTLAVSKQICGMVNAHNGVTAPHSAQGPLCSLVCAHLNTATPNFFVHEIFDEFNDDWSRRILTNPEVIQTAFAQLVAGKQRRTADAETTPMRHPEHYQYDLNLADIAEVWRRGSVIASWLLDLTALALLGSPDLADFRGRVSDSGEGRWTVIAAIDESAPAPVISAALYDRFSSRGEADFADKVLSAMRHGFGGHEEKAVPANGGAS